MSELERQITLTRATIRTLKNERDKAIAQFKLTSRPKYEARRDDASRQMAYHINTLNHLVKIES